MRRNKRDKKRLLILLLLLLTVGLGIGYAVLTENLILNNSVKYDAMKWNVGFSTVSDGGGTIASSPVVSADTKTVTVTCDIGSSTVSETCIAKAKIKNDSTFQIYLGAAPTVTFDDTYINSVTTTWITTTNNTGNVKKDDFLKAGEEHEIQISIVTKDLTKDILPSTETSVPITVTMNWIQKN